MGVTHLIGLHFPSKPRAMHKHRPRQCQDCGSKVSLPNNKPCLRLGWPPVHLLCDQGMQITKLLDPPGDGAFDGACCLALRGVRGSPAG